MKIIYRISKKTLHYIRNIKIYIAVSAKKPVVKPAKKVAKPAKKVVKPAKKHRRNNIRGGVGSQTRLSPVLKESKVELQRASLLSLPPSTRVSVSASRSLRPLPLPVSSLSSVSSSASGSANRYRRTGNLQPLPEPPLTKEEAAAIADREAIAAKERRIARETIEAIEISNFLRQKMKEKERKEGLPTNRGTSSYHSRRNAAEHQKVISGVSSTRDQNDANQATRFLMQTRSRYQH